MKRALLFTVALLFCTPALRSQTPYLDSLRNEIKQSSDDTLRLACMYLICSQFSESNPDSSLNYGEKALALSEKLNFKLSQAFVLGTIGYAQMNKGLYSKSLQSYISGIELANDPAVEKNILPKKFLALFGSHRLTNTINFRKSTLGFLHEFLGILYENTGEFNKELEELRIAKDYAEDLGDEIVLGEIYYILGRAYLSQNKPDSGLVYEKKAYDMIVGTPNYDPSGVFLTIGKCYVALGKPELARDYLREALRYSLINSYLRGQIAAELLLADISNQRGEKDSALYFERHALSLAKKLNVPDLLLRSYSSLAGFYNTNRQYDSTAKYQALIIKLKDSIFNSKQIQEFQHVGFEEQQRQQELALAKKTYRNQLRTYGLVLGLLIFLLVAVLLWRNNRTKEKAYALLKKQKQETDFQKNKAEETLEELKSTQSQLVQREKMASLGELTAGIAHEIQNPLNFVNNFSDINTELLNELKNGPMLKLDGQDKADATTIIEDLAQNLEKINHHGRRADAIVKGMLQHSRTSSGHKEPTDINALAEEYLRLSYHGLRSKDKSFNAELKTNFDERIGKVNLIPQDIGRVLLNMYNNAFYEINEKKKLAGADYTPILSVSTKLDAAHGGNLLITIKDNGPGISDKILDKIFQPFFTTKPPGEGTGLGLSLSYDIIKAHGGKLDVETKEGEGTNFVITLPIH